MLLRQEINSRQHRTKKRAEAPSSFVSRLHVSRRSRLLHGGAQLGVGLSGLSSSTSEVRSTTGSPACSRAHVAAHTSSTAGMKASKESYLGGHR